MASTRFLSASIRNYCNVFWITAFLLLLTQHAVLSEQIRNRIYESMDLAAHGKTRPAVRQDKRKTVKCAVLAFPVILSPDTRPV